MYTQLSNNYKYKVLAEQILARETNLFNYRFNIANYEWMSDNTQDTSVLSDLDSRISNEKRNLELELLIYNALLSQIDDKEKYLEAVNNKI